MNVLILTPDAVGSTLLQRLITIYMQFYHYDRPVINLHELTTGLVKYYNPVFDQEVLGKKDGGWTYHQSTQLITKLLQSVDHYKTSRLTYYHIKNRQDSISNLIPFYQYLNDNFYIISCRRHNVFEHALSWCLSKVTKKLNVYTADEKINSFFNLYKTGLDIDPNSLIQSLNAYRDYLDWCNNHFNVANYFYYDEHLPRIENYILNLPIFSQQQRLTWKDHFDMDFNTWNRYHYMTSDIGTLALDNAGTFQQLTLDTLINQPGVSNDTAGQLITQNLSSQLPASSQEFLQQHKETYQKSIVTIDRMIESGIIVTAPPIKKQTLAEKKHIIRNYQHLLDVYNKWIAVNPNIGLPLDSSTLDHFARIERARWNAESLETQLSVEQKTD
jgi:hypothetical protein